MNTSVYFIRAKEIHDGAKELWETHNREERHGIALAKLEEFLK